MSRRTSSSTCVAMSCLPDTPMLMRRLVPVALLCAAITVAAADLAIQAPADPTSTRFAVIGDTGTGDKYENDVAQVLIKSREVFPYTFVLMMGDNLYGS